MSPIDKRCLDWTLYEGKQPVKTHMEQNKDTRETVKIPLGLQKKRKVNRSVDKTSKKIKDDQHGVHNPHKRECNRVFTKYSKPISGRRKLKEPGQKSFLEKMQHIYRLRFDFLNHHLEQMLDVGEIDAEDVSREKKKMYILKKK